MSPGSSQGNTGVRLLTLIALAAFCAFHWSHLVVAPPAGRIVLAVAIAGATAAALAELDRRAAARPWRHVVAAVIALAGIAAGLVAVGLEPRLLAPGNWGELITGIERGLIELGDATYPYEGEGGWPRLVLLLGLPASLGLAATLAFWPSPKRAAGLRWLALGVLVAAYGVAVILYAPALALLNGIILLALIAAWLWAPSLPGPRVGLAGIAVGIAGIIAAPVAAAMDRSDPILDYRSWSWTGATPSVEFDWDHTYEPLDWPRDGTPMLDVRADAPHYWRAAVLERFDGFRWVRSESETTALELPNKVEGIDLGVHEEWYERTEVTVRELRSGLVVGPGSVQAISGLSGSIAGDGTALAGEIPSSGQTYEVTSYAPDPSAAQMRAAPDDYVLTLERFTLLDMPTRRIPITAASQPTADTPPERRLLLEPVPVPLRGEPLGEARRKIQNAGYGDVLALSRELTRDAPTAYDAVKAIERHLQSGFTYTEAPPQDDDRPLRSFLLTDRVGYCQQFSGAMALMLRMNGIPARVVSGFSPGVAADEPGVFTVRDTDAHSWTEVYFMGIGWVPFDPTPTDSPAQSQTSLNSIAATPGDIPGREGAAPREARATGGADLTDDAGAEFPWEVFAAIPLLLGIGTIATVAMLARRRLRFGALSPRERAEAQVRELEFAFDGTRYRSRDGATLLQLERQLRGARRPAAAYYARCLLVFRYAPEPETGPTLRNRSAARRELAAARGLRSRLRLLVAMPPGGPAQPTSGG